MASRAKVVQARAVENHVDLTVAELVVKYLQFAGTYYVKNGKPTSQKRKGIKARHKICIQEKMPRFTANPIVAR
jgi:hypothetical protein